MVTYRKELARKGWHRPVPVRVFAVVAGALLVLLGLVMWTFEQEMGGWEGSGLGHHSVEEDAVTGRALIRGETGEVLFESASIQEANEWVESQRNRNFTVPILVMVAAGLLVVVGVAPSPRKPAMDEPASPRPMVNA